LSGANSLTVSPDGARLYAAGSYGASIAELAIDPISGKLSQSTAPNDCAQTGTVDNCAVGVGALEQVQPGAAEPFAFTATLAASPHGSAPPTLYAAAFDGSALHIFDVPGGTHPTPLTSGQARLCSYRGHTFICLPLQCRLPKLCDGSLRVTLPVFAGPIAARIGPGLPRTVTLASARFKIRRGRVGTVRARITPAGARLLRGERRQHRKALTITVRFALRSAAPRYVREVTSLHL
jgi:hypothetical protein